MSEPNPNDRDSYSHLTPEQLEEITISATAEVYDNCSTDYGYLRSIVEDYIGKMNVAQMLDSISDDRQYLRLSLSFDPETGQPWKEDEDGNQD